MSASLAYTVCQQFGLRECYLPWYGDLHCCDECLAHSDQYFSRNNIDGLFRIKTCSFIKNLSREYIIWLLESGLEIPRPCFRPHNAARFAVRGRLPWRTPVITFAPRLAYPTMGNEMWCDLLARFCYTEAAKGLCTRWLAIDIPMTARFFSGHFFWADQESAACAWVRASLLVGERGWGSCTAPEFLCGCLLATARRRSC